MTNLDISEGHIIEMWHSEGEPPYSRESATALTTTSPGATDPMVLVDGIDHISVVPEDDGTYLIHYRGFLAGYLRVTEEGVEEFGETYLDAGDGIPNWSLKSLPDNQADPPWWVPDSYDPAQTVECVRCRKSVPPYEIVTPGRVDGDVVDWFCSDCWEDIGERWSPEWSHAGKADIHRARYLEDTVRRSPEDADIEELAGLVQAEESDARNHALTALGLVVSERGDDVASLVGLLADRTDHEDVLTQFGAVSCLAVLAEHDHDAVLPFTGEVIKVLDPSADAGVLEEGISFVAAVAEDHPEYVRAAAPKLAALLSEDPPHEKELLGALVDVAREEPDAVASVASPLRTYVSDEQSQYRARGLAALGYATKESPEVAEASIPTLVELLEASSDPVRANAAGVLADLSSEYPDKLVGACEQLAPLATDEDANAQHNATYVLSQVAQQYPGAVEPAVNELIAALEADRSDTRFSACRALGYVGAESAIDPLEERRDTDSEINVQRIAGWALGQIGAGDPQ